MTWLTAALAGAGAAALLLTAGAVVNIVRDEQFRECAEALAGASAAITAHQEALTTLDREMDRRVINPPALQQARADAEDATRVLDAARDDFTRLCLTEPAERDA